MGRGSEQKQGSSFTEKNHRRASGDCKDVFASRRGLTDTLEEGLEWERRGREASMGKTGQSEKDGGLN